MNAFRHFGGWMAIAITLVSGFSRAAEAQVSEPKSEPSLVEIAPNLPETVAPTPDAAAAVPSEYPAPSPTSAPPSLSQVELPFSDVSPDHWAYEALLFLSTGSRHSVD